MLRKIAQELLGKLFWTGQLRDYRLRRLLSAALEASSEGDKRDAIRLFEQCRRIAPENMRVLNGLAGCLEHIGEENRAQEIYELAYRLDDSNLLAGINRARHLAERGGTAEALPYLARAQLVIPYAGAILTGYTGVKMRNGEPELAKAYALRAWMTEFDSIRYANSYLFTSAYTDMPEATLAAEHHFWGQTCALPKIDEQDAKTSEPKKKGQARSREVVVGPSVAGKLRIGYWSPDLRDHSVRYFFRPLLEGHDRRKVELVIYNDSRGEDAQTGSIREKCDHYFEVFEKTDAELYRFIASHQLDVLVELAGHTSFNRLPLLKKRMARLQVTGIGYPFTTGLRSIDAKMLDPQIMTEDAARYYAEQPLLLPESFWCFDPMVEVPLAEDPPCVRTGNITFGCFGNISKINEKIARCWGDILRHVPGSRLLLQSVNFNDSATLASMADRLSMWGLPIKRLQLRGSVRGSDFFRSYDDVDIILDTHPFNGGTTTGFAVYMGVPVISLRGRSILSRMGHTILTNAGSPELAVDTLEQYVRKAVELSSNNAYLKCFRQQARARMKQTGLGDGQRFARHFEEACRKRLEEQDANATPYEPAIDVLPAVELIRRAGQIFASGHREAGVRVTQYCLQHYPNFGPAHILATEEFTRDGDFTAAADYLEKKVGQCADGPDKVAMYINIVRCRVLEGSLKQAEEALHTLAQLPGAEPLDLLQIRLCSALLTPAALEPPVASDSLVSNRTVPARIRCVIACDDPVFYRSMVQHMTRTCLTTRGCDVEFVRCDEMARVRAYQAALRADDADAVLLMRKNVVVLSPHFFTEILRGLDAADMVGYGGGLRWTRLDWQQDDFDQRAWGCLTPSGEKQGLWEVSLSGKGHEVLVTDAAMLAGECVAVRGGCADLPAFDQDLLEGGELLEQMWTYQAARAGMRLAIHRNLGIAITTRELQDDKYAATIRADVAEKMAFDVFILRRDGLTINMPCSSMDEGLAVMGRYLNAEALA